MLLEIAGVDATVDVRQILFGVDLDIEQGQVVSLLGPNGAGKTTLLRTVAGLGRPDRGTIRFNGRSITTTHAAERVAMGIAFVPDGKAVFPTLSVWDNLLVACHTFAWDRVKVQSRLDYVVGLFPRLGEQPDQAAASLSGGEQQMLALAKGLVGEPTLLLVDEISLGLSPATVADLLAAVAHLKAAGMTMLIVAQSPEVVRGVADREVWMDRGTVLA